MRNFVIINGVNSNTINGLGINELPPITKPEMRNIREEIDGRDGDITTNLGYSAYDKTITIGLFGTGYDINDIVAFFNGEGTIVFSNEQDKYYNFKILNQIDYESLQKFRTASITFHCQPFKYPLTETPLEIEYDYIEQTGEILTLSNTGEATLKLDLKGNTSQSGTPTPTSPIPVSVVSGDNDVVVCGKNICSSSSKISNQIISFIPTKDIQKTFTLSFKTNETLSGNTTYLYLDGSSGDTLGYLSGSGNISKTFTLSDETYNSIQNATTCEIRIYKNGGNFNAPEEAMIVNGTYTSETLPPYEPYQSQTYPINLGELELCKIGTYQDYFTKNSGKNLFNKATVLRNKTFTSADVVSDSTGLFISDYIKVKPNTDYYVNEYASVVLGLDKDKNSLGYIRNTSSAGTFTTGANCEYIRVRSHNTTIPMETAIANAMLNIGSTAQPYEPYGTNQWCKYNAIGKVVLNGSENWVKHGSIASWFYYDGITNGYVLDNTQVLIKTNYYTPKAYQGVPNLINGECSYGSSDSGTTHRFVIKNTDYTQTNDFKTWLGTHNTIVYYVLVTPYLSLIEDNNLIEQLDNIQNAMSYEGTTNIGQVNNDKPFIISAKALEDGTNEVVVNNIGNVYSKPLLALEGSGNVDIYLDNTQILKANVEDKMNIDIAQLEAYNPDTMTLLNRQVIGNYNSMTLQPGNNTIRIDGALDKATITNYTRWL